MFVRACESIQSCTHDKDLELLIYSSHLVANSHQIWSQQLKAEVEDPLLLLVSHIKETSIRTERENKAKVVILTDALHKEEDASYKLGKKNRRDLGSLQQSLQARMTLAEEIRKLSLEYTGIQDEMAHDSLPSVLEYCSIALGREIEGFEVINEGLKKCGAFEK